MKYPIQLILAVLCFATTAIAHNPLPTYRLHGPPVAGVSNPKSVSRSDAVVYFSNYYAETSSNTAYFKLPAGTIAPGQSNQRIEAYTGNWTSGSRDYFWEGTYYIAKTGNSASLFQMKSPDNSVSWAFQLKLHSDGRGYVQHLNGSTYPNRYIRNSENMKNKSFKFKVVSNGPDFDIYIDGQHFYTYTNTVHKTGANYAWRWGLYVLSTSMDHEVRLWNISYTR